MQKSDISSPATMAHRKVQSSTTLNRKYVSRPMMTKSMDGTTMRRTMGMTRPSVSKMSSQKMSAQKMSMQKMNMQKTSMQKMDMQKMDVSRKPVDMAKVSANMKARTMAPAPMVQPTAQELKERAIAKALSNAAKPEKKEVEEKKAKKSKLHLGVGRVILALSCAAAAVFAIVYFVNLNMPDISMRVAAMQSGIDPKYPGYVPRDFSVTDMVAEEGKITLNFKNSQTGDSFSISEERSSWDSNALLSNFVKNEYGEDFATTRENGLTIYMTTDAATWVNGGMLYKLNITSGTLTKKQIRSIAVSL